MDCVFSEYVKFVDTFLINYYKLLLSTKYEKPLVKPFIDKINSFEEKPTVKEYIDMFESYSNNLKEVVTYKDSIRVGSVKLNNNVDKGYSKVKK